MSNESSGAPVALADGERLIGKCWVAVRGDRVVAVAWKIVPHGTNFDRYSESCREAMAAAGDLRSGSMVVGRDGLWRFRPRQTHPRRSKSPRPVPADIELHEKLVCPPAFVAGTETSRKVG